MKKLFIILVTIFLSNYSVFAQNGIVKGRIFDALTNESMPFVNVLVKGTTNGAASDENGNFEIKGISPGYVRLQASFLGYEAYISDEILVTNAKVSTMDIALKQANQNLSEVTVSASAFTRTVESPVSLTSIGLKDIESNPGSNRDISKVIQSFPGIGSTPSFRNDIIVRGGGPSECRFYLDGVEIPNINHFSTQGASGGAVGILNADFISSVNYYSGAFPSNRGNALSGIFEFTQKDGNKDKQRWRFTVGASEMSLSTDGPIGKNTTFVASARQSYLQFLFNALGLPFLPTFNDFQFKSRTRINAKNELTIVGVGAIDQFKMNTKLDNPTEEQQYILDYLPVNEQWNYTIGTVYKHFEKHGYQTIVLSRNMLNNVSYKYPGNDESKAKILDYHSQEMENRLRWENNSKFGEYKIIVGVNGEYDRYLNDTYQKTVIASQVAEINYNSSLDLFKWGTFAQISRNFFGERLSLSAGLRGDANSYSKSMQNILNQLSPRFSLSYLIVRKLYFNFNIGKYYQSPAYTTLGYRNNSGVLKNKENDLKYISSAHTVFGLEFRPNENSQITVETFYKKYENYPFSLRDSIAIANKGADFGSIGDEEVKSSAKGRAMGLEITARLKSKNKLNLILAYTLVRSEFTDAKDEYIPSSWDSKHLFTITLSKEFKKNWTAGFKWRYVGGLPYTPYNMQLSEYVQAWDTRNRAFLDYSRINTERFKPFHQLDIRVDKNFYFKKWSLMLYFDIQNAYNFKAEQQPDIVRVYNEDGTPVIVNPTAPISEQKYQLKELKNTSGTILPTVGIMIEF